jgi:hypothetical protein
MPSLHTPVLIRVPGMVQAQVYCPAETMTPAFAERVAGVVETIAGVTFSHVIRDVFPALRKKSIAEEAAAAWAAPKRRFRLSNEASNPEHIQLLAGVMPRASDAGRVSYGYVTLLIKAGAAAASAVAGGLEKLVAECNAVYARADAPTWGTDSASPDAFGTLALPVASDWLLGERLGWVTYLPATAWSRLDAASKQALAALGANLRPAHADGGILQLTPEPLRDGSPEDLARYQAVRALLAQAFSQRN